MWVEDSGGVQTAGFVEGCLSCTQSLGNVDDYATGKLPVNRRQTLHTLHAQGVKRGFSADTTARGCIKVPLQAIKVDGHAGLEFDANRIIARAGFHDGEVICGAQDALREQKTDGEVLVVAGRAHRDRDALSAPFAALFVAKANLERLLDSNPIIH
jgi:hypothetical protein